MMQKIDDLMDCYSVVKLECIFEDVMRVADPSSDEVSVKYIAPADVLGMVDKQLEHLYETMGMNDNSRETAPPK